MDIHYKEGDEEDTRDYLHGMVYLSNYGPSRLVKCSYHQFTGFHDNSFNSQLSQRAFKHHIKGETSVHMNSG